MEFRLHAKRCCPHGSNNDGKEKETDHGRLLGNQQPEVPSAIATIFQPSPAGQLCAGLPALTTGSQLCHRAQGRRETDQEAAPGSTAQGAAQPPPSPGMACQCGRDRLVVREARSSVLWGRHAFDRRAIAGPWERSGSGPGTRAVKQRTARAGTLGWLRTKACQNPQQRSDSEWVPHTHPQRPLSHESQWRRSSSFGL